jgi:hypothetical protein
MTQKLTRNTNDERWREFWKGVDAAAARAPRLHYEASAKTTRPESTPAPRAKRTGKPAK